MSDYRPASCNIGRPQRRRRLALGAVALAVAAGYVGALAVGFLPSALLVGVFVPLALGIEYAIQAYTSFCVRLALLNRYDFRADGGGTGTVSDPRHRRADQVYAAKITAVSVAVAGAVTAVLALLL